MSIGTRCMDVRSLTLHPSRSARGPEQLARSARGPVVEGHDQGTPIDQVVNRSETRPQIRPNFLAEKYHAPQPCDIHIRCAVPQLCRAL